MRGGRIPIRGHGVAEIANMSYSLGEPWGFSLAWINAILLLSPQHVIAFCNSYMIGKLCSALEETLEIGAVFVWKKPNAPPNCRNTPRWDCEFIVWAKDKAASNIRAKEFRSQVLEINFPSAGCFASERILRTDTKQAAHPTQKPIAIVMPFVDRLTETNWTILDPFMGTGTTGMAAVQLGRNFIGCEISEEYFKIAKKRIEDAQKQLPLF